MTGQPSVSLDTSVFDKVIETGDIAARTHLARQLADFIADPRNSPTEKGVVIPPVLQLAVDPVADVRRELAQGLRPVTDLNADVLFTIVADDDAIALPFLAECAAIDPWRMLAILQVGDASRQLVIAARPDLPPEAVAHVATRSSLIVVAAMLDNVGCHIPGSDYRRLYVRFRDEPEIVERLLKRKDLPLEVRILQAKRASSRIQKLVMERGWIAANDAESIIADVEETTVLKLLEQASADELDRLVPFLGKREMLNAALVMRACCRGQMAVVERSMAWLSSMSLRHVHGLIEGNSRIPLKAMFSASGLPKSTYAMVRASIDVWREIRAVGEALAPEQFSRRVVETLVTRYDDIAAVEKIRLLDLVAKFSDERTRSIVSRLKSSLQQQAA
ncbi:MAG: DUF2336 domain-containing protein [Parvibaculaceae bacterium]